MGNKETFSKDDYYMHIQLIGLNMKEFFERIKDVTIPEKKIKNYWEFDYNENEKDIAKEIDRYFTKLDSRINEYDEYLDKNIKDIKIEFREVLIFKIDNFNLEKENGQTSNCTIKSNNISSPELDIILERLNNLYYTHFMPLVLLLSTNKNKTKLNFDTDKYKFIDPKLILVSYYNEEPIYIDGVVDPILLRFCSIHNELGDRFSIKDEKFPCDYDLIEEYFPFNLNIACIGRCGQGKSTGVNILLQEYKARASSKGGSQTKQLTFYHSRNQPVKILDIPGFEDEKTVKDVVSKFKLCDEEINKIKDNIHIILYFLNYHGERTFYRYESPILEEIKNHKSSKIIYVITHCKKDMILREKKDFIRNMKEGLNAIIKDDNNIFEPTLDNVIFLNFCFNPKTNDQAFGEKELFKKIHDFFIQSDDYKESCKDKKSKEEIENEASKLRASAQSLLFYNKIFGAAVGWIPGIDWLAQKYLIKKDAARKIGMIFQIDVKFINESSQNQTTKVKDYDKKGLKTEVKGDHLIEENVSDQVKEAFKIAGETGVYINGGTKIVKGITYFNRMTKFAQVCTSYASEYGAIAQAATEQANSISWIGKLFTNSFEAATSAAAKASTKAEAFSNIAEVANNCKNGASTIFSTGLRTTLIGCVIGLGLGGYFTHKFCEDLLDKFVAFYKENAEKITNSYEIAAKYFENIYLNK